MKPSARWGACALLVVLAGCGEGGGVSSTPTPTPVPTPTPTPVPTPTPTPVGTITHPGNSQSFVNDAVTGTTILDLTTAKAQSPTGGPGSLTINYDAASRSYTIAIQGRQQTFGPADIDMDRDNYVSFAKPGGSSSDYLTVGANIIFEGSVPQYVGMGLWQHNDLSGSNQNTILDFFTYGFPTPASAVPRSGTMNYAVNMFGALSTPNVSLKVSHGVGTFSADLGRGLFSLDAALKSFDFLTGQEVIGGGIQMRAGGRLSGSDGSFSGNLSYQNLDGLVAGKLTGRLYGPNGQEVGGVFSADSAGGGELLGALSGTSQGTASVDFTLDQLRFTHLFPILSVSLEFRIDSDGKKQLGDGSIQQGNLTLRPDGSASGPSVISYIPSSDYQASDRTISPDPNFVRYQKDNIYPGTSLTEPTTLDLYKPGSANTQLALTFLSFGIWEGRFAGLPAERFDRTYLIYGMDTAYGTLARRTGSAHYDGLVRGAGLNSANGDRYELTGTSAYDVNFTAGSFSGSLAIKGDIAGTGQRRDFGAFGFTTGLDSLGQPGDAVLTQGGRNYGDMKSRFYGPDGEEVGSVFTMAFGNATNMSDVTQLSGISVAKRTGP